MSALSVSIDLNKVPELGDAMIDQLSDVREQAPIVWNEASRCWMVMRHSDILDAFQGKRPLSAVRFAPQMVEPILGGPWQEHIPMIGRFVQHWVTNVDGQAHVRMRYLASKAFSKPVVESVRPFVVQRIGELLEIIRAKNGEVEFVEDIARELPGRVILRLMGLPDELYARLKHWANSITAALGAGIPTAANLKIAEDVIADMTAVFTQVLAERRAQPQGENDFMSLLLSATDESGKLSEDEMIGLMQLVVFAGHDTTANSMSLGVAGLARNPDQWRFIREHPDKIGEAVQEIMRLTAMSAAQNRTASADFEWHGAEIKKGDPVFLMIAAGNRDPRVFANPEKLDIARDSSATLVFGPGLHHCIGHLLAKMQLGEFFLALTQHFDGADVLDDRLEFQQPILFRGLESLHMRFHPAQSR
jgi:cytochrome P450